MSGKTSFLEWGPNTIPTPASGSSAVGVDTAHHLYTLNSSKDIWIPGLQASAITTQTITSSGPGFNAVASQTIPIGLIQVGTTFRISFSGLWSATVTPNAAVLVELVIGIPPLGVVMQWESAAANGTGTNIPFTGGCLTTVQTVGVSATVGTGGMWVNSRGVTGIVTAVADAQSSLAQVSFDSTTAKWANVTLLGGSGRTIEVDTLTLEILNP